jgi:protein gp37
MSSDFFVEEADEWREEAWSMLRQRKDLFFFILTKRILRFWECAPKDWGDGYPNVSIVATIENQRRFDERAPFYSDLPIRRKRYAFEPLLGHIDALPYLMGVEAALCGGESGQGSRICDYEWVASIREQCVSSGTAFVYHQTGRLLRKSGRIYEIPRNLQEAQAKKAGIDYSP